MKANISNKNKAISRVRKSLRLPVGSNSLKIEKSEKGGFRARLPYANLKPFLIPLVEGWQIRRI